MDAQLYDFPRKAYFRVASTLQNVTHNSVRSVNCVDIVTRYSGPIPDLILRGHRNTCLLIGILCGHCNTYPEQPPSILRGHRNAYLPGALFTLRGHRKTYSERSAYILRGHTNTYSARITRPVNAASADIQPQSFNPGSNSQGVGSLGAIRVPVPARLPEKLAHKLQSFIRQFTDGPGENDNVLI